MRSSVMHEGDEQDRRHRETAEDKVVAEGALAGLDQPIDQARQRRGEQHEAEPVGPAGLWRTRFGHPQRRDDDGRDAERHVHEEDPAPGEAGGQQAARQGADRDGQAGHSAPDAERDATFLATECVGQQGQRHREHDRPADALQPPGQLQHQRAGGEAAQGRCRGEDGQADQVHQAAAVHIRQAARGEQERGQSQRVGVDDPLQVGEAGVQGVLDVRQGDVHDRDVQQQHERAQADGDERPPLVAALGVLVLGLTAGIVDVLARTALVLTVMPIAGLVERALTNAGHVFVGLGHDSSSP